MFYKYLVSNLQNEEILYLFLENNYEIAHEFKKEDEKQTLKEQIINYIAQNQIAFSGKKVYLVVHNLIIASVFLKEEVPFRKYIDIENLIPDFGKKPGDDDEIEIIDISYDDRFITIKYGKRKITTVMRNWLENALFNHIPITYEKEALKAVSVLLRTNCLREVNTHGYIIDIGNYMENGINRQERFARYESYLTKLQQALKETDGQYLTFNGKISYLPLNFSINPNIRINNYGMNLMAKSGYNYSQILAHYYPNTVLKNTQS